MSLTSLFEDLSPTKSLSYGLIAGGSAFSLVNGIRIVNGDYTAAPSLLENFATIATGIGLLQAKLPEAQPASILAKT